MNDRELLDYRDGHEQADVSPVLVDRLPGGGTRVVVRYPYAVRAWARNRFLIAVGVVLAWGLLALQIAIRPRFPWWGILASGWWPIGPSIVVITGMLWQRANRLYILTAEPRGLTIEIQGLIFKPRHTHAREHIKDIRIEQSLSGRPVALTILATHKRLTRRLFDDLDGRLLTIIADALREGLQMPAPPSLPSPPR